ncbi:PepSY domain-containing protein [Azospirillum sp.]|uniref:PepSY domain-containing protein n=1 Tax=Azospirillum sp. TaxID=34012 RepID=UPI002D631657|nr:PepSY domain-containing protein [Azospirillum sp.]HYD68463.1 PepSY domain-containing protein [Azospirillum sp.]
MTFQKRLALLGAATAALLSSPALAADKEDIQALTQARLSLTQAIEEAGRQGNGRAVDAEFDVENGAARYEVTILGADRLVTYTLDANTGAVVKTDEKTVARYFTRLDPADLQGARTTLEQAIGIAEQRLSGKAIEAEVERDGDAVRYEVTVAHPDGRTQDIKISGVDGQVAER